MNLRKKKKARVFTLQNRNSYCLRKFVNCGRDLQLNNFFSCVFHFPYLGYDDVHIVSLDEEVYADLTHPRHAELLKEIEDLDIEKYQGVQI